MAFAPENPLEEMLHRAVRDPSARPLFFNLMLHSPLFVVGRVEGRIVSDEIIALLDTHHFELAQVTAKGRPYHLAFTALSRLRTFRESQEQYFRVIGRTLFDNTRGAAFLINYGSDVGKELLPQEIEQLLGAKTQTPPKTDVVLSLPDPYPGKLAGALGMLFLNRSQVVAAHMVQTVFPGRDEPAHLLIALVAHGDARRIVNEIGEVAKTIHARQTVDVMVVDPTGPRSEVQSRLLALPPFYDRPITPQS